MKSHTRLLASLLTIATIANATGCSRNGNDRLDYDASIVTVYEENGDSITNDKDLLTNNIEVMVITPSIVPTEEVGEVFEEASTKQDVNIEELLKEALYDESMDYKLIVDKYLNIEYAARQEYKNEYLRAIYMLMINSNVPMSVYLKEIHTLMILQQYPGCVPEELWFKSFEHLLKLLGDYPSLHEMFIDFGMFAHELECSSNHSLDEYGSYTCDGLEKEYELIRVMESY